MVNEIKENVRCCICSFVLWNIYIRVRCWVRYGVYGEVSTVDLDFDSCFFWDGIELGEWSF